MYNMTSVPPLLIFYISLSLKAQCLPKLCQPAIHPQDVGCWPTSNDVKRPLEGCQSSLIIVNVRLIGAWEDNVWLLLSVIVWLTHLIHDITAQTTGEHNSWQIHSTVFHSWIIISPCCCSVHLSSMFWWQTSDLCSTRENLSCGGLNMERYAQRHAYLRLPSLTYSIPRGHSHTGFLCDLFGQSYSICGPRYDIIRGNDRWIF